MTATDLTTGPGSTSTLTANCWTLDIPDPIDGSSLYHARTEAGAKADAAQHADDHDCPPPAVRRLEYACHVLICGCGYVFDVDDTYEEHFLTAEEAAAAAVRSGWTADLRCPACQEGS